MSVAAAIGNRGKGTAFDGVALVFRARVAVVAILKVTRATEVFDTDIREGANVAVIAAVVVGATVVGVWRINADFQTQGQVLITEVGGRGIGIITILISVTAGKAALELDRDRG